MRVLKGNSGITVLFRPMKSHLVDFGYYVRCGAMDENPGKEGYCHALEHMLFGGTENRTWLQINRDWEKVGADFNAITCHDKTIYQAISLKKHWQETYEVLADILYNCTFPSERWEDIEKNAVVSEIQSRMDSEELHLEETLYKQALGGRYHPVAGSIRNVQGITSDDLKNFYDEYYCGNNIYLVITGDLTERQVLRAINKYDRLRQINPPKRRKLTLGFDYKALNLNYPGIEQNHIQVLMPLAIPRTLPIKIALNMGTACMSQYLFEELREKRGLCYDVSSSLYWDIPRHVYLHIRTSTHYTQLMKTYRVLQKALRDFDSRGMSAERIRNIKNVGATVVAYCSGDIGSSATWIWEAWEEGKEEIRGKDPFETQLEITNNLSARTIRKSFCSRTAGKKKFAIMTSG